MISEIGTFLYPALLRYGVEIIHFRVYGIHVNRESAGYQKYVELRRSSEPEVFYTLFHHPDSSSFTETMEAPAHLAQKKGLSANPDIKEFGVASLNELCAMPDMLSAVSNKQSVPEDSADRCRECGHALKRPGRFCPNCGVLRESESENAQ